MGELAVLALFLSIIGGILLLSAAWLYYDYSQQVISEQICENEASKIQDENRRGEEIYYCLRAFSHTPHQDIYADILLKIGEPMAIMGAILLAVIYRPGWLGLVRKVV